MAELLKSDERIDDLQRFGLKIIQHPKQFRFSTDAVLISEFATVNPKDRVIDMGSGSGIIPLLVYARKRPKEIVGLEIVPEMVDMSKRSIALNGLEDKINIVQGDICHATDIFGFDVFDVVTCNPPYIKKGSGELNSQESLSLARHELACTLEDVITSAARLLKSKGRFCLIHRPERLPEIFYHMVKNKFAAVRMRMVQPYVDTPPNMVMIEAVKAGAGELKVSVPLVLYKAQGIYTDETRKIYNEEQE